MDDIVRVTLLGDPVPKGRPRVGSGQVYTPHRTADAENHARGVLQRAYGARAPYAGAVGIDVVFYCATRRRVDGDNLLKLLTDAMQRGQRPAGGVILDDSQIEDWRCRIHRRAEGQDPRTELRVFALEQSVAPGEAALFVRGPRI